MPAKKDRNPISLEYAAAANLLFSELKIKDNIADKGVAWRLLAVLYKNSFRKAIKKLEKWGLDAKACYQWANNQQERELAAISSFDNFESYLNYCAEPTAQLTAMVFKTAAKAIAKPELADSLHILGYSFGKMMYQLDALEDVEKDRQKSQFNPLLSWFSVVGEEEKMMMTGLLEEGRQEVEIALVDLPLLEERKAEFAARLQSNIAKRQYQWE